MSLGSKKLPEKDNPAPRIGSNTRSLTPEHRCIHRPPDSYARLSHERQIRCRRGGFRQIRAPASPVLTAWASRFEAPARRGVVSDPKRGRPRDGEILNYTREDRRNEFRDCDPDL